MRSQTALSLGLTALSDCWRQSSALSRNSSAVLKTNTYVGPPSVGGLVILAIYPSCRATVLGMTALKQMAFSLAFAIAAVAAAQYVMWILNGQP